MRIAFLNYYQKSVARGLETFVSELSRRLGKKNEVLVVPSPVKISGDLPQLSLFRPFFLDLRSLKIAVWTLTSLSILNRFRPQIVFAGNGGWQALICSLYCRFSGAKLVIVGQSGPGFDDRWNLLMKPRLFVALTRHQLAWAKQATFWKQDFALLPNGVDLDQFRSAGKKLKLVLEKPIIMIAAASTSDKRVEQGIRAVTRLTRGSLLLLGRGPLDKRIDKLGYKLLGKKRFFHTSISHDRMPDYYRSADVFTLCSASSEAFGIVYLEAMASGLPIVATDDGSRREIVGEAGVFVKDPDDPVEYAAAITKALGKNWGDIPRRQAEKFSWDKIAAEYEKILS